MLPKEFNQIVQDVQPRQKERDEAWRLYKSVGPDAAVAFVKQLEEQLLHFRNNLALRTQPVPYRIWGEEFIEKGAIDQMIAAARLPVAVAGALMPDAHQGYGLPIGGVLATDNAVIPYAVGVDIACRMMLTIYPASGHLLKESGTLEYKHLKKVLLENTLFGSGKAGMHEGKIEHPILDEVNWRSTTLLRSLRPTAIRQIGTSGTGNHFVEWGELEVHEANNELNLEPGNYLALLSHSGSRGVGFKIAEYFTQLAMAQMPELDSTIKHLAWLSLDRELGQEYWQAMQLAGEFASANHHVIHDRMAQAINMKPLFTIENHHNFAWREKIVVEGKEREVIVHRKGATPAGKGLLGVIPGTMADIGFVVAGKGNAESLSSASHGSGRLMSRTSAFKTITHEQQAEYLAQRGVTLIGGGLDEAPQAYKSIRKVMEAQHNLVTILATFQPRIVRMAADKLG